MSDLGELKPCPFCGGSASIERYGDEWGYGRDWNERADSAEITRLQKELETALPAQPWRHPMSDLASKLRRAIENAEERAGTSPARSAVKLRPADWDHVCRTGRKAAAEITRLQKELERAREALANDRDESLWRFWNGKARKLAEDNDRLRERVEKAREAARQFNCPRPCNGRPDDFTVGQCYDAGECGCLVPGVLNGEETASGLSPWQGWDQSRTFWSETKHKDAVCHAVFGPAWSMEDAHVLISFIEKTWGRSLKDKEVAG